MNKIILIGICILLIGCTTNKPRSCNMAQELGTGDYLVIQGFKADLNFSNGMFVDCCCNLDYIICICSGEINLTNEKKD